MYAGGWITHANLHRPQVRPVVYRQPLAVYIPPINNAPEINTPPVTVAELKTTASIKQTAKRRLVLPMPLVLLLIVLTMVISNAVFSSRTQPIAIKHDPVATPVAFTSTPVTKPVDPKDLQCMAENIYFEAGGESLAGKMAVGLVVLNRLKSPAYPKTVCGVVHQKNGNTCMFSWLCEPAKQIKHSENWQQSQQVAHKLLSKEVEDLTDGSTNFHGMSVNPKWKLRPTVRIDGHQFYR